MELLQTALDAAAIGGKALKKYWGRLNHIEEKAYTGDLVTEADKESERCIMELIQSAYPSHAILSEEAGASGESKVLWVIDPLDGTTNFTHCYPFVCISIAVYVDGVPEAGVIYNPILEELYHATKGGGAFCNGTKMHVSKTEQLSKALLATGFSYDRRETRDNNYAEFAALTNATQGVRRAGSAALDLAYLAKGSLDGYWERGLQPWDMAAGILLVQEAGGKVTAYNEEPFDLYSGRILASNGLLHGEIAEELGRVKRAL